ncbi:MAG TPA: DUF3822 family protein [Agriterribacter sp.]|nr:DUF3822 family protein [Chitinophagaceae bacterium]HRP33650.1 DUF3822 family protein [Agriterribacter sp.]
MSVNVAYQIQVPVDEIKDAAQCNLYVEVAADHLLFGILDNNSRTFIALHYVNLEKYDAFNHCKELIYHNEWLSRSYNKVTVVYYFPESVLVPDALFNPETTKASLDLIHGDLNKGELLTDTLPGWELRNIYRVPAALHQLLGAHFPKGHFYHAYSVLLKRKAQQGVSTEGDEATLIFYPNKLLFALFRNGALQIVQTFEYETAEDVTWHLLNACRRFEVDCSSVLLNVSGLLDDHSSVYSELLKYFLHIKLEDRPADFNYSEAFDEYPLHFFSSLFNTALCE